MRFLSNSLTIGRYKEHKGHLLNEKNFHNSLFSCSDHNRDRKSFVLHNTNNLFGAIELSAECFENSES